jgi:hypothetical protein
MKAIRAARSCPACGSGLTIQRLHCGDCGTAVEGEFPWPRLARLSHEDQHLIELLILSSGSLKSLATTLGVSYPTVRKKVDAVIARLEAEVEADEVYRLKLLREVEEGLRSAAEATGHLENL